MCGICGVWNYQSGRSADRSLIEAMCTQIMHRGPDDQGIYLGGSVGLGMRRLSIIDLHNGRQPVFNEDRTICGVFNGEIYNFRELRKQLVRRGHRLVTRSDSEVIVHLYEDFGCDFVDQLNGMFALAIWDEKRRRLVLARDRLGQKPLYYAHNRDGLVFGSELKCILQADGISSELNPEAVYHYFTLGYIPNPLSIYQDIRQLPPAGRLVVNDSTAIHDQFWSLSPEVDTSLDYDDTCDQLYDLLRDAVRRRMISDVPLGAFLSGGLDSSIIVALMAQHSTQPVKTFHIDFVEEEFSERCFAREVASRYGTDHHELVVRPSAVDTLDILVDHFDEPFADSSAVPTYLVSKMTSDHVTVALAGDAGDESFGGYDRYRKILARRNLPVPLRRGLGQLGRLIHRCLPRSAPGRRYFRSMGSDHLYHFSVGTDEFEARELLGREFLESIPGVSTSELLRRCAEVAQADDPLSPYSFLDLHHYLPDDILTKVDRMSMANSLEVRAPLLDYRIVELAARLPHHWKIKDGVSKKILKDTFGGLLPNSVTEQRKRGFAIPLDRWLRHELRPMLTEAIHDHDIAATNIFCMREVKKLAHEHFSERRDRGEQLWRYLFFAHWWHRCYKQRIAGSSNAANVHTAEISQSNAVN